MREHSRAGDWARRQKISKVCPPMHRCGSPFIYGKGGGLNAPKMIEIS